ncbi:glycoside hydrolase family 3 protein [Paenibacillus sp. Dod16]|uniref:glycoside hydrolase family 3 protein n=1 Tax=Paenibacillus sp. Dod16 TaxID=3416392 RepID=UPI003CF0ECC2
MKFTIKLSQAAAEVVDSLTNRELLDQVCCPTYTRVGPDRTETFGAMFFHPTEREELEQQIERFQSRCKIPPFIVSDLECGAGNMVLGATKFPSMMSISQTNSVELAYEVGAIAAKEAGELGYNWTFSPVADLAYDPDSPVVGIRSAGKDPEHTIKMVSAYMRGLQDHGMMATIKHFPGDGFGTYDQHLTTPVNPLSREEWRAGPGKVFKDLIDDGAMAIMPGHISLPAFDEIDEATGTYPPATISRKLLVDLLRGELGFDGLIVTDAVEMGGLVGYINYFDACALALENGCDILLFTRMDDIFYREMEQRLETGMLSIDTLKKRALRIVSLKFQLGLMDGTHRVVEASNPIRNLEAAKEVVAKSITVVRDRKQLIPYPITRQTRVLHVVIMNHADRFAELYDKIKDELGKHTDQLTQWVDPGPDNLYRAMCEQAYDLVICSIGSKLSYGLNVVRLHDEVARNMMAGWSKLGTPIIFVSHFHSYVHKEYETSIDTIVNTYGDIDCTIEYLIEGIFGKRGLNRSLYAHD